ncbi:helix-turn-helix domain-containing protein [Thalassoroseus pseudoceratinae]|uniref:helix-turn-helix domain-containing protein n=1 Tax=Thalassoroseus pseudoceratinae TaxID=2713176 RepID=UPI0014240F01|nr:helix-turn-helix transcriptional regulator [Thalassoroseus pseudoceratinae]
MSFGEKVRALRQAKTLTLRQLALKVDVGFTYLSKIENDKLEDGHTASESLIDQLATVLDADADELLLLAKKVPPTIRQRIMERPEAFRKVALLDNDSLEMLADGIDENGKLHLTKPTHRNGP